MDCVHGFSTGVDEMLEYALMLLRKWGARVGIGARIYVVLCFLPPAPGVGALLILLFNEAFRPPRWHVSGFTPRYDYAALRAPGIYLSQ